MCSQDITNSSNLINKWHNAHEKETLPSSNRKESEMGKGITELVPTIEEASSKTD